jgi:hypothetical protein
MTTRETILPLQMPALHHLFFESAKLPPVRQPASVFPETGSEFLAVAREKLTLF